MKSFELSCNARKIERKEEKKVSAVGCSLFVKNDEGTNWKLFSKTRIEEMVNEIHNSIGENQALVLLKS